MKTIAIGNFDGVHRGHQELIARARAVAAKQGGSAGVLTFDPHPAKFFAPALAPPMLITLARRLELLAAAGAGFTIVEPFDAAFAGLEAGAFVTDVLGARIGAAHVVVGYDFSFGRGRRGDAALLVALGKQLNMGVTIVPPVRVEGLTCSSTKIREFVLEGRVEGARMLLGRPFEITGEVVRGTGRGRTIGVPTANVRSEGELLPKTGIYAGFARCLAEPGVAHMAAISVGTNPTFQQDGVAAVSVEAHILDFAGDVYGQRLRTEFAVRLRDEQRFSSVPELVAEIGKDIVRTRELLA